MSDNGCMSNYLADGDLLVVETMDDDLYVGTVEVVGETLVVRSGFQGRPVVLDREDVASIVPASQSEHVDAA